MASDKDRVSEKFERELEVPISAAVIQKKLERIAEALDEVDVEKGKMKVATEGHRETIKRLNSEEKKLRSDVAKKTEKRMVKCVTKFVFRTKSVQTLRMDTRAIVEERPMTPSELQEEMNYKPGSARGKGATKGLAVVDGGRKASGAKSDASAPDEAPDPEPGEQG